MARLLVLGAGGFIGRAVRHELTDRGHEVASLDRVPAPGDVDGDWFELDLLMARTDEIAALMQHTSPEAVINCAGLVEGSTEQLVQANVLLVARLLEAARGAGVRLVHIGSAAEYGPSEPGSSVGEDDAPRPLTPYAVTKLAGTLLVANAVRSGAGSGVALRLFNPLGPGMPAVSMPGRAAGQILAARASGAAEIHMGPLSAWRDFIDLRDAAAAIAAAALTPGLTDPILNLGTGTAAAARDVVEKMAEAAGWRGRIVEDGSLASPRSADVSWQQAATERIRGALGWRPAHSLREAAASVLGGT